MGVCCSLVFRRRRRAQRSVLDGWLEGRLGAGEVPAGGGRRWRRRQISPDYPVHPGQSAFSFCSEFLKNTTAKDKEGGRPDTGTPSKRVPGTGFFSATLPRPTTLHRGVVGQCRAEPNRRGRLTRRHDRFISFFFFVQKAASTGRFLAAAQRGSADFLRRPVFLASSGVRAKLSPSKKSAKVASDRCVNVSSVEAGVVLRVNSFKLFQHMFVMGFGGCKIGPRRRQKCCVRWLTFVFGPL